MQEKKQRNLTPEFWKRHKLISEDLKNGTIEQLHGVTYNQSREEALKHLEELRAKNKAKEEI